MQVGSLGVRSTTYKRALASRRPYCSLTHGRQPSDPRHRRRTLPGAGARCRQQEPIGGNLRGPRSSQRPPRPTSRNAGAHSLVPSAGERNLFEGGVAHGFARTSAVAPLVHEVVDHILRRVRGIVPEQLTDALDLVAACHDRLLHCFVLLTLRHTRRGHQTVA